jgi:hypothetical protein
MNMAAEAPHADVWVIVSALSAAASAIAAVKWSALLRLAKRIRFPRRPVEPLPAEASGRFTRSSMLSAGSATVAAIAAGIVYFHGHGRAAAPLKPAPANGAPVKVAACPAPANPPICVSDANSATTAAPAPKEVIVKRGLVAPTLPKKPESKIAALESKVAASAAETRVIDKPPPKDVVPWSEFPTSGRMWLLKSKAARDENKAGSAVISCILAAGGTMWTDCKVEAETPPGYGFGEAALKVMAASTMRYEQDFITRVGAQRVSMTITLPAYMSY